jgi:hypothetical protein
MKSDFRRLSVLPQSGSESFHAGDRALAFQLLDFWRWSTSDLVSNATRGKLAEFIVLRAIGITGQPVRDEWAPYDLLTAAGVRIEVKSAAYVQSWHQRAHSSIIFSVRKTRKYDPDTNRSTKEQLRTADVYVFALLAHLHKASIDPLDMNQWQFFVLPTFQLDQRKRSQSSITLKSLQALAGAGVSFAALSAAITSAFEQQKERMNHQSSESGRL